MMAGQMGFGGMGNMMQFPGGGNMSFNVPSSMAGMSANLANGMAQGQ
jgi:hypothetical protein